MKNASLLFPFFSIILMFTLSTSVNGMMLDIDTFSYETNTTDSTTFDDASILGGEIDISYGVGTQQLTGTVTIDSSTLQIGSVTPAESIASIKVFYDGNDSDASTIGAFPEPLDLSTSSGLSLDIVNASGSVQVVMGVRSTTFNDILTSSNFVTNSTGTLFVPWGDFTSVNSPTLSTIRSFELNLLFDENESIEIDNFQVIPEPSVVFLLGFSLLGLAYSRRFLPRGK